MAMRVTQFPDGRKMVQKIMSPDRRLTRQVKVLANDTMDNAISEAPVSDGVTVARPGGWPQPFPGQLKNSHRVSDMRRGSRNLTIRVINFAPHARYVHEGTTGPITPEGPSLRWAVAAGGKLRWLKKSQVRGQKENPWMERAHMAAARSNRHIDVIRGF